MIRKSGLFQILFPLQEELVLLFVVAGFAAGDEIAFGAVAAADQGNEMVHRELRGLELPFAVITDARGLLALPPLAGPKLTGLGPLPGNLLRRQNRDK
jgi:hypothetical protein